MSKKPDDIAHIEERLETLKTKEALKNRTNMARSPFVHAAALGFRIAIELLSGVLVGAGVGHLLDKMLGTKPIFMIALLFVGAAAGFLNTYRCAKEEEKKKEK